MEMRFSFEKMSDGWNLVKIRTLFGRYHYVPAGLRLLNDFPPWFKEKASALLPRGRTNKTKAFGLYLVDHELKYFYHNRRLYVDGIQLTEQDTSIRDNTNRRKNNLQRKKIRALKFNHQTGDAMNFVDQFRSALVGVGEAEQKVHLLSLFVLDRDKQDFSNCSNQSIDGYLELFVNKYYVNREDVLNKLKSTPFSDGVENFVFKRFQYYSLAFPQFDFKSKYIQFVNDLPVDLKPWFTDRKQSDMILNSEKRIISYLNFKLDEGEITSQQVQNEIEEDVGIQEFRRIFNRPSTLN